MTMEIKITLDPTRPDVGMDYQLTHYMRVLGFERRAATPVKTVAEWRDEQQDVGDYDSSEATTAPRVYSINEQIVNEETYGGKGSAQIFPRDDETTAAHVRAVAEVDGEKPKRIRRTRAQIAADEAAAKEAANTAVIQPGEFKQKTTESLFGEPAISTGEPRIDPQDAADEARESAANKTGLTKDDVREAINRYRVRHGIVEAQADIPAILGCSIADLPDDAETLQAAITLVDEAALAKPSLKERDDAAAARKVDVKLKDEPAIATKEDVMAALRLYADKYDGKTVEMREAKNLLADVPKVLQKSFGEKCVAITMIPADGFGKAVAAIKEAIATNPYKRTVAP